MTDADVIVVGGGPAGCSTAWSLARLGVDVLLLDRARFPREKTCAEYLSPQASRLLAQMGALAACEDAGAAHLAGMIIRAPNGAQIRGDFIARHGFRGFRDCGLALRRVVLDQIVLERARAVGVRVEEGSRVTDVVRDAQGRVRGVRVLGADGTTRERSARLVIGADGLRSVVARRLGLAHSARTPRRLALVAHYRDVACMGAHGEMHVERDGYIGLADVGGGVTNVAVVVPIARARGAAGDPAAFMDEWIRRRPHLTPRFKRAMRVTAVLATGPFASAVRRAWAPGAAMVGDAADFFDPFTGEGIYAALRGAELLAPRVIEAIETRSPQLADASLAAYDVERVREFRGKWAVERMIGAAVSFPALMNLAARSLSLRPAMAHTIVGVTGDFVPAREVLRPGFMLRLLLPWTLRRPDVAAALSGSEPG